MGIFIIPYGIGLMSLSLTIIWEPQHIYIVNNHDSILLAVAAVSGGSGPPKVQRCNIEVEHVTAES